MNEAELEVKRNGDKQLVILKTTSFIVLPISLIIIYFKSVIIHFFNQTLNFNLSYEAFGFIYIIFCISILKIALYKHNKKTRI